MTANVDGVNRANPPAPPSNPPAEVKEDNKDDKAKAPPPAPPNPPTAEVPPAKPVVNAAIAAPAPHPELPATPVTTVPEGAIALAADVEPLQPAAEPGAVAMSTPQTDQAEADELVNQRQNELNLNPEDKGSQARLADAIEGQALARQSTQASRDALDATQRVNRAVEVDTQAKQSDPAAVGGTSAELAEAEAASVSTRANADVLSIATRTVLDAVNTPAGRLPEQGVSGVIAESAAHLASASAAHAELLQQTARNAPSPENAHRAADARAYADATAQVDATSRNDAATTTLVQANDRLTAANAEVARIAEQGDGAEAAAAEAATAEYDRAFVGQQTARREATRTAAEVANINEFARLNVQLRSAQLSGNQDDIAAIQGQINERFVQLPDGQVRGMDAIRTQSAAALAAAADEAAAARRAAQNNPVAAAAVEAEAALRATPDDAAAIGLVRKTAAALENDRAAADLVTKWQQLNGRVHNIATADIEYALGDLGTPEDQVQPVVDELLARRPGDENFARVINQVRNERETFWEQVGRTHENLDPLVQASAEASRTGDWSPVRSLIAGQLSTQARQSSSPETVPQYLAQLTQSGPRILSSSGVLRDVQQEFMVERPLQYADEVAQAGDARAQAQKLREVTDGVLTDGHTAALTLAQVKADGTLDRINAKLYAPDAQTPLQDLEPIYVDLSAAADSASRSDLGTPLVDELATDLTPFLEKNTHLARNAVADGGGVVLSKAIASQIAVDAQGIEGSDLLADLPDSGRQKLANDLVGQIDRGIEDLIGSTAAVGEDSEAAETIRGLAFQVGVDLRSITAPLEAGGSFGLTEEEQQQGLASLARTKPELLRRLADDGVELARASYELMRIVDGGSRYEQGLQGLSNHAGFSEHVDQVAMDTSPGGEGDPLLKLAMAVGGADSSGATFTERLRLVNGTLAQDPLLTQQMYDQAFAGFAAGIEKSEPNAFAIAAGHSALGVPAGTAYLGRLKFGELTLRALPLQLEDAPSTFLYIAIAGQEFFPNNELADLGTRAGLAGAGVVSTKVIFNAVAKRVTSPENFQKYWRFPPSLILLSMSATMAGTIGETPVRYLEDKGIFPTAKTGEDGKPMSANIFEWLFYSAPRPLFYTAMAFPLLTAASAYQTGGIGLFGPEGKRRLGPDGKPVFGPSSPMPAGFLDPTKGEMVSRKQLREFNSWLRTNQVAIEVYNTTIEANTNLTPEQKAGMKLSTQSVSPWTVMKTDLPKAAKNGLMGSVIFATQYLLAKAALDDRPGHSSKLEPSEALADGPLGSVTTTAQVASGAASIIPRQIWSEMTPKGRTPWPVRAWGGWTFAAAMAADVTMKVVDHERARAELESSTRDVLIGAGARPGGAEVGALLKSHFPTKADPYEILKRAGVNMEKLEQLDPVQAGEDIAHAMLGVNVDDRQADDFSLIMAAPTDMDPIAGGTPRHYGDVADPTRYDSHGLMIDAALRDSRVRADPRAVRPLDIPGARRWLETYAPQLLDAPPPAPPPEVPAPAPSIDEYAVQNGQGYWAIAQDLQEKGFIRQLLTPEEEALARQTGGEPRVLGKMWIELLELNGLDPRLPDGRVTGVPGDPDRIHPPGIEIKVNRFG